MNRALSSLAALPLLALGVFPLVAGQALEPRSDLSEALEVPGSLQSTLRFEHLTTADGLSNDSVFSILQDRHGFMWFGTQGGLNRYDGYRITQYRRDPKNSNSLGDDFVQELFEDSRGGIWCGRSSSAALSRFDPDTETFAHYTLPSRASQSHLGNRGIFEDSRGFIWVGCSAGCPLSRFDPKTKSFRCYSIGKNLAQDWNNISAMYADSAGILWLGTPHGLVRFDPATGAVIRYLPDPPVQGTLGRAISAITSDKSGKLWMTTADGAQPLLFDPITRSFIRHGSVANRATPGPVMNQTMYTDPSGTVWLGTMEGLKVFDPHHGTMGILRNDPADRYSLSANEVWSITGDREGNLWVGVKPGGVNRVLPRSATFGARRHDPGNPDSLSDNNVRAIIGDRTGSIWIGTYSGGLNRFDPGSGKFVHYRHDPRDPRSLDNDLVYSIYEDRSGALWSGTAVGINRLNRKSGTFDHFSRKMIAPQALAPVYYFLEDRSGRFWYGLSQSKALLDRRTGISTSMGASGGLSIFEDHNLNLWFDSFSGVTSMDPAGRFRSVALSSSADTGMRTQVNFFHEDSQGILWLATEAGLVRLDPKTGKYTNYTTWDGLPDNVVQCILSDHAGNLWLSTNYGLSNFNPRENSFRNYHESDGLQGEQFNRKACFEDGSGRMYFGGVHGFNVFDPREIGVNPPAAPPLVLTEFQIHGRTVPVRPGSLLPRPILQMDKLQLSHRENGFSFEFAALSYQDPARTRYRFKLEGLESQWTEVDSRHRYARYTDLQPGNYSFRVQASPDGRTWSEKGTSLGIVIAPPWWMTPWSNGALLLTAMALILGAHWWRVKALEKREVQLETLVGQRTAELVEARDQAQAANRTKSAFLASMSHELRTPLNAILGFSHLLRDGGGVSAEQAKDLDIINHSGEHLLELINDVLDVAKIEAGRIVVENAPCDLQRLVHGVIEMMQLRAREKSLQLLVEQSAGFPSLVLTDASKLRQILINLVGNAVKYTERGSIILRLDGSKADASDRVILRFEIEDTGIGIAAEDHARIFEPFVRAGSLASHDGTGLGLAIVRKYLELMGGTIRLESMPGKGSRFHLALPVEVESEAKAPGDNRARVVGIAPGQPEFRVLIVEDQFENRLLLRRLLEGAGFRVQVAENGEAGIEIFKSWRPHFIWMDRGLPGIDGMEAVRRIRKLDGGREVKIAAVTASTLAGERDEMLASGLNDFLSKPYRLAEIFDCMARHLGVRYIRAKDAPRPAAPATPVLRPEALAALPEEVRKELADALIALDVMRIAGLIRGISELDPALGGVLAILAGKFAYTPILKALLQCDAKPPTTTPHSGSV